MLIPRLLNLLGELAQQSADFAAARALHEEALELSRDVAPTTLYDTARSLQNLGDLARHQGDCEAARGRCEESVALWRETGNKWLLAEALSSLGAAARAQGDARGASGAHRESLAIYREFGNSWGVACGLEGLAMLAEAEGDPARAARLFGGAQALREVCGAPLPPAERPGYERAVAALRAGLGEELFTAAWGQGRAMTREQALAFALEEPAAEGPGTSPS